eukprot:COSAG06_NODE_289_length_18231_cov_20.202515_17_plen_95_part_00
MRLLIKYLRTWWRTRLPLVLPLVVVLVVVLVLVLVVVVVVLAVLAVLAVAEGSWMRQQIGTENRPCASCPRQKDHLPRHVRDKRVEESNKGCFP